MTLADFDCFENDYFSFNKQMLRLVGLWPHQDPKQQFFINCIVNLFFVTGVSMKIYEFSKQSLNFDSVFNHLQLVVPTFCIFVCYNTGVYNSQIMMELHDRIKFDITAMKDERETTMLRKYYYRNKMTTWIITFLLYTYYFSLVLPSIFCATLLFSGTLNDTRVVLPISAENLVDTKMYYYGMLLYQFLLAFVVITVTAATYTSFMALIQHACLLLAIVILKINGPFVDDSFDNQFLGSDVSNIGYHWIIDIIKSYMIAVEFVKLINILSEKVYLVEVGASVIILIICFLYLSNMYLSEHKNIGEIAKCVTYSATIIFLAYINCYVGQMLINHNSAVSRELRQISFYKLSVKIQKLLPLVMLRCTKPCALMIGGLFVSSHGFFASLVHTSISYAMVCHTMR